MKAAAWDQTNRLGLGWLTRDFLLSSQICKSSTEPSAGQAAARRRSLGINNGWIQIMHTETYNPYVKATDSWCHALQIWTSQTTVLFYCLVRPAWTFLTMWLYISVIGVTDTIVWLAENIILNHHNPPLYIPWSFWSILRSTVPFWKKPEGVLECGSCLCIRDLLLSGLCDYNKSQNIVWAIKILPFNLRISVSSVF